MKVCISLRDPANHNLRKDNLRSEPRWERLVLEACLHNPEIKEIYTLGYEWAGGRQISPKYKGLANESTGQECVLLLQDWNTSVATRFHWKAIIVNIFHGPWMEQKEDVKKVTRDLNGNVFFVLGHPLLYQDECGFMKLDSEKPPLDLNQMRSSCSHLGNFVSQDHLYYLPLPWIPENCYQDRFLNKVLLWPCRLVFVNAIVQSPSILWALSKLQEDPTLRLEILTGWKKDEVKDYINNEVVWIREELNEYFWKQPEVQSWIGLRDRVKLYYGLDWCEVLSKNASAKLMILHARHYGGPPMEASMYGVPFVGMGKFGAMAFCPDFLTAPSAEEAHKILDRLLVDHDFYQRAAQAYNKYAYETYSFTAFNTQLNKILSSRGLL